MAPTCELSSTLQRVLAAMAAGEARPTHVASVRERHAILAAALESLRQLGGAGSARRGASTHDPASVSFPRSNSSAALPPQAAPQRAERGPSPAGIALVFAAHAENSIETCADGPSAAAAVSLAEKATGLSLQQAAASLRRGASGAMPPRSTQTGIPPMSARGASGGALAASTTAGRIRRASDAVSLHSDAASSTGGDDDGGGGRGVMSAGDWGVVTSVAVDEAAVDPQVQARVPPPYRTVSCAATLRAFSTPALVRRASAAFTSPDCGFPASWAFETKSAACAQSRFLRSKRCACPSISSCDCSGGFEGVHSWR